MKNLIVVLAILFSIILINEQMFSQKREYRDGKCFRMEMKERLNLTDQQEDKMESLRLAHQEKVIKFKADLDLKELEIRKIKSSDKMSRSEMIRIEKEINVIKNEMALERVNHQMDVYDNLDANQRKTWLEKPQKFGCKMHCKMGNQR